MKFTRAKQIRGEVTIPGDKSISHRAVMFGSLAEGATEVTGFLRGADCLSTIDCFRRLGISIEDKDERILIHGKGLHGLSAPAQILDAGNSGTTTRLISGILSGQAFETTLTGDASIQKRPMGRIIEPLSQMGASITSLSGNGCAPLRIQGRPLHGIHYTTKVASAQVKSSILLAGLYADTPTSVTEPALSRNHSELMLHFFGADVKSEGTTATIQPEPKAHRPEGAGARRYLFRCLLYRGGMYYTGLGAADSKCGNEPDPGRHLTRLQNDERECNAAE